MHGSTHIATVSAVVPSPPPGEPLMTGVAAGTVSIRHPARTICTWGKGQDGGSTIAS